MHIDGEPVEGDDHFDVHDPGRFVDTVATVAAANEQHIRSAVAAAHASGPEWAGRSVGERITLLTAALDVLDEEIEGLIPVLSRENGGTPLESRLDLTRGAELFRDMLGRAETFLAPRVVDDDRQWLSIERSPVGVAALIVPWNSPVVLTMSKLAPALVAGNTVVVKPSVYAPVALTAALTRIAGHLPRGVLNVVHGDAAAGTALVSHPLVRKVAFTGSVGVGTAVMAAAAATVKNVSLELGGNDAAIILDDADIEGLMPQLSRGVFTRAGQVCFAVKRIYVPDSRYDEFYDALCAVVDTYRVGYQLDEQTTFGPLINAREHTRVSGLVERARRDGNVRELGQPTAAADWPGGHYLRPAVVRDIAPDAELVRVEQFGPVIPLVRYRGVEAAVAYANDSEFGLASSVWSADADRALAVARRLEAGVTFVNSHNLSSLSFDVPFGGVKRSGLGRERTEAGLAEYVEEHAIRIVR
jgi:acyl-CoA reductase-like NAD-dependent aldehyde dehydrogenase